MNARCGAREGTAVALETQAVPEAARLSPHHQAIDEMIRQMREGQVKATLADGRQPILFHPLTNGGENMVFTGQRLPLEGAPYDLPYVLKIGLYATSGAEAAAHARRMEELHRHFDPTWFPREHVRLHTCSDGERRLLTMQQPVRTEDSLRLTCGYAETRTAWNQAEIGTVGPGQRGGLHLAEPACDAYTEKYVRVTRQLVLDCAEEGEEQAGRDDFLQVQRSRPLSQLVNAARRDAGLRTLMREYVERAIGYSDKTGEVVDILGEGDNVTLHRGNGKWNVRMLDPLHPCVKPLRGLRHALTMLGNPDEEPENAASLAITALNGMNYVRTMNGLARTLNLRKRLLGWREKWNDDVMRSLDLPLIMRRCRETMREEETSEKDTPPNEEGLACPREQLQILMRLA